MISEYAVQRFGLNIYQSPFVELTHIDTHETSHLLYCVFPTPSTVS